jgi:ABC-type uncharacterized transport system substrate-binding protein
MMKKRKASNERKKGAKISLSLYDDSFFVDLAFEVIERAKDGIVL